MNGQQGTPEKAAKTPANSSAATPTPPSVNRQTAKDAPVYPAAQVEAGDAAFQRNCAFCHGRDAGGGESGPDLTRSKLVAADHGGDQIGAIIRNGRVEKGMPRFNLPDTDIAALVAYVHTQKMKSESRPGGRRGVDPEDLLTGDPTAGKGYFNGEGHCNRCHSAERDLAGIARRFSGLKLEERMLFPRDVKSKVTVETSGKQVAGTLAYLDEFTVGMTDDSGQYHSWPAKTVRYRIDAPVEAHADQLGKYTDDDIHNLMAYLQTLK